MHHDLLSDGNDAEQAEELSLERLSQAFAEALSRRGSPARIFEAEQPATEDHDETPHDRIEQPAADAADVSPLSILEAMLFVGHPNNEPLTAEHAAKLMRGVELDEVHRLVHELNHRYQGHGCPYHIVSEGPGYLLVLREEFHRLRNRFYGRLRAARLSQAAIEVLSLVAYNQPLTREDIDRLRGVQSGAILAQLVRRRLLRLERTETKPRKTLYYTTGRFLTLLGLDSLEDLPQSRDLEKR
jgi:segregation and condensation protein B